MKPIYTFIKAFESREDLKVYGQNALTLFALQLFFSIEDITTIATDNVTDGGDDGGIDLVYVDRQNKYVVIAQDYIAISTTRVVPKAKKVRDLSSGLTLLIKSPIDKVPKRLQSAAEELRTALNDGQIENVHIWFVHNLPGSKNIKEELRTVEHTASALLNEYAIKEIKGLEVCADEIERKWLSISTPILINEDYKIPYSDGFSTKGDNWKAFVTSVSLNWIHEIYQKHNTDLFSANVRDYLGIVKKDKNINKGIQDTALNDPNHFWVFNNGITALVNNFEHDDKYLSFNGFSILNGAQTTGAVGNLDQPPDKNAMVQIRFVMCTDVPTVVNIKRFNNSQNKIDASDFRSNDNIQKRLSDEFQSTDISYSPRRGGMEDAIRRKPNTLSSVLAGQILSAFHGRPDIAYHRKTEIWDSDTLYNDYFNEGLNAKHIFFAYSLFEAIRIKKIELNNILKKRDLNDIENEQINYFQKRGSIFLLTAAISNCVQIFLDTSIPNKFRLEFKENEKFEISVKKWMPIIDVACSYASSLQEGFSEGAVHEERSKEAIKIFSRNINSTKSANKTIYDEFSKGIHQK